MQVNQANYYLPHISQLLMLHSVMFVHQQKVEQHHEELPGEMDFIKRQSGKEYLNSCGGHAGEALPYLA